MVRMLSPWVVTNRFSYYYYCCDNLLTNINVTCNFIYLFYFYNFFFYIYMRKRRINNSIAAILTNCTLFRRLLFIFAFKSREFVKTNFARRRNWRSEIFRVLPTVGHSFPGWWRVSRMLSKWSRGERSIFYYTNIFTFFS